MLGVVSQTSGLICRLAQGIFLARLLSERDFGLVAISMVLFEFANLIQGMGLEITVIQKGIEKPSMMDTAFTSQFIISIGMTLVFLFVVAPLSGVWFRKPEVVLLVQVQSFLLLINAFCFVPRAALQGIMNFRATAVSNISSAIVSAASSIIAAWALRNYWAIVIGQFTGSLISMFILLQSSPYRIRFRFDPKLAKSIFRFSFYVLLLHFVAATGFQLDKIIGGRLLTTGELGFYSQAYRWGMLAATSIIPAVQPVLFSAYCQRKAHPDKVKAAYLHSIFLVSLILVPCSFGLFLTGDEFVKRVLGERWLPAAWPMRMIALISILRMVNSLTAPLIQAMGRPDFQLRSEVFSKIVFVGALLILCKPYGIIGVVTAVALHHFVNQAGMLLATTRLVGVGTRDIAKAMTGPLMLGTVMMPCWFLLKFFDRGLLGFSFVITVTGLCYVVAVVTAYRITSTAKLREFVFGKMKSNLQPI